MKTTSNAVGQPAGAGTLHAHANLSAMWLVAELAIARIDAENNVRARARDYQEKIWEYERKHGRLEARLNPERPEHKCAIAYTADTYAAYRKAKRQVYNVKRRLDTAVRRARAAGVGVAQ